MAFERKKAHKKKTTCHTHTHPLPRYATPLHPNPNPTLAQLQKGIRVEDCQTHLNPHTHTLTRYCTCISSIYVQSSIKRHGADYHQWFPSPRFSECRVESCMKSYTLVRVRFGLVSIFAFCIRHRQVAWGLGVVQKAVLIARDSLFGFGTFRAISSHWLVTYQHYHHPTVQQHRV